jgi:teichuronic acid biosynthesis glycosyltransferase TuaC
MVRIPKGSERLARALGARLALRRNGERPSLVHAHFLFGVAPAAVALARALGVPAVVTVHGTDARWLLRGGVQERLRAEMLEACLHVDRVIAVSPEIASGLVAAGVPASRVVTIPMGVDADLFRPADRSQARHALGIDPDARVVAFVGRAIPEKGFAVLDEALARLPGVAALAVGSGPLASARIRRLGVLDAHGVAQVLAAADVFCLPSFAEGTPVSVAEALASGRPVVTSAVGGMREQVEPGRNGFVVQPGDAEGLAAMLAAAFARDWSAAEIRSTSERYWWANVGPRIAALYEELLP